MARTEYWYEERKERDMDCGCLEKDQTWWALGSVRRKEVDG